jgi:hypothetical protein
LLYSQVEKTLKDFALWRPASLPDVNFTKDAVKDEQALLSMGHHAGRLLAELEHADTWGFVVWNVNPFLLLVLWAPCHLLATLGFVLLDWVAYMIHPM